MTSVRMHLTFWQNVKKKKSGLVLSENAVVDKRFIRFTITIDRCYAWRPFISKITGHVFRQHWKLIFICTLISLGIATANTARSCMALSRLDFDRRLFDLECKLFVTYQNFFFYFVSLLYCCYLIVGTLNELKTEICICKRNTISE